MRDRIIKKKRKFKKPKIKKPKKTLEEIKVMEDENNARREIKQQKYREKLKRRAIYIERERLRKLNIQTQWDNLLK